MNRPVFSTLILGLLLVACEGTGATDSTSPTGMPAAVVRVVDGDTLEAQATAGLLEVRLDGINAPERNECFSSEATARLSELVTVGTIHIRMTGEDQFNRILGHVWHDQVHVNLDLVATGHAIATTPLTSEFAAAERAAIENRLGLWSPTSCATGPIPEFEIDMARSVVDPPGPDDQVLDQELIVLVNRSQSTVDLTGWVLRDESSRHRFHFPPTSLSPGQAFTVRSSDAGWDPGGSPVWNNNGDIIMLLDSDGRVVTSERY